MQEERKKVSVGEALEAMRTQPASVSRSSIVGRGASYWLESLMEGATRRQTDLFESIRSNNSAQAQMFRRDMRAVGDLGLPREMVQEMRQPPVRTTRQATGLKTRFSNVGELRLDQATLEMVAHRPERPAALSPGEAATSSVSSRFQNVSSLDLAAFYAVEEVGVAKPAPQQPAEPGSVSLSRFAGIGMVDFNTGLDLQEVKSERPAEDLPKRRLKTNPNIRRMFEQNVEDE